MPIDADGSIEILHLRELLSKIPYEDPQTLVPRSPSIRTSPPDSTPEHGSTAPASSTIPSTLPYDTTNTCPASHEQPVSHDRSANLQLTYSITYSQIDLGETQVDSDSQKIVSHHVSHMVKDSQENKGPQPASTNSALMHEHEAIEISSGSAQPTLAIALESEQPVAGPELEPEAEVRPEPLPGVGPEPEADDDIFEDEDDNVEGSVYFPESSRFNTSKNLRSSPVKIGHNPLAHLGLGVEIGAGTGMSLSQVFNAPSSPVIRTRTESSQPPPTPSFTAARMMAQSMPLSATVWKDRSSPAPRRGTVGPNLRRGTSEPPEFLRQPSVGEQSPAKCKVADAKSSPLRRRSFSPDVFSSPPVHRRSVEVDRSDSEDDIMFSDSEDRKRRVQAARKEGIDQLRTFIQATTGEPRIEPKTPKRRVKEFKELRKPTGKAQLTKIQVKDGGDDTGDDTGDDDTGEGQKTILPKKSKNMRGAPKDTSSTAPPLSVPHQTQVPASPLNDQMALRAQSVDLDETWEQLHGPSSTLGRSRSYTSHRRNPRPAISKDTPKLAICGTSTNPASLKQMVPFNVPLPLTLPDRTEGTSILPKDGVEYIRESSGLSLPTGQAPNPSLMPNTSSPTREVQRSSPPAATVPSQKNAPRTPLPGRKITVIPETSPTERWGMVMPAAALRTPGSNLDAAPKATERKLSTKRRRLSNDRDVAGWSSPSERPPSQLKSFATLDISQLPLSSQEEPDEVDMIDIVQNVGAGKQPELEMPAPPLPALKGRPNKRRKMPSVRITAAEKLDGRDLSASTEPRNVQLSPPSVPRPKQTAGISSSTGSKVRGRIGKAAKSSALAKTVANMMNKKEVQKRRTSSRHTSAALADSPTPMATDIKDNSDVLASHNPAVVTLQSTTAPHRVFALFRDAKLQYHPATIIPNESQTQIKVAFDDGTEDVLERQCVRSLDLRLGDVIKVDLPHMKKLNWVVKGFPDAQKLANAEPNTEPITPTEQISVCPQFTDIRGRSTVSVAPKNAESEEAIEEVPVTKIYLIKSLWSQFVGRDTSSNASMFRSATQRRMSSPSAGLLVIPSFSNRRTSTPTFMGNVSVQSPSARGGSGMFQGMVFALSFGDKESEKRSVENKIRSNGGQILELGFDELFHKVGPADDHISSSSSSREPFTAAGSPFRLRPEAQALGFAAVIANQYSRRAKFLQALALGLPCLAGRWIDDCVKRGKILEWEYYLLPAGESTFLGGAVRSRVLPGFDATTARLREVEGKTRILTGWNVLTVTGKQSAEKRKAFAFLAHALGADRVVKVKTLEAANKMITVPGAERCDCVLVGSQEKDKAVKMWKQRRGLRVLDDEQLIQSLILGRLLE